MSMSEFTIGRRQLYILPTKIGWYYTLILLALFAIAVKFDNQPAFIMLFLLISVSLIAMLYTHNNVINLSISQLPSKNIYCGESASFPVLVKNDSDKHRYALWLMAGGFHKLVNLKPYEEKNIELKQPSIQRGYLECSPISLTSQFPIGLFFCWSKRLQPTQRCLVYPQAIDLTPIPEDNSEDGKQEQKNSIKLDSGDYAGMKTYQQGDRIRDIHWPSLAKTQKLITIQHESKSNSSVNLSWFSLPNTMNTEDKLSQLCFWLLDAEKRNTQYQLEMPSHTIEFNRGPTHLHQCLSVLALWGNQHA